MKKQGIFMLIVFFIFFFTQASKGTLYPDASYSLSILNLNFDIHKLKDLCHEDNCYITDNSIEMVLKSSYNEHVSIIIKHSDTPSLTSVFSSLKIRLPSTRDESGNLSHKILPDQYNWEESVKRDLRLLKKSGVLVITDEDIKEISSMSRSNIKIMVCNGEWKSFSSNCTCDGCTR